MDQFKVVAVDDHLLDASDGEEDNLSSDELIMDAAEEQQLLQDENGQSAAAAREQREEESEECDTLDLGINDQERFPDDEEDEDDRLSDPGLLSADYDETTPRTEKQHNAKSTPPPPRGSPFSRLGSRPNDRGRRGGDFRPRGGNRGSSRAGLRGAVSNRGFFRPSDLPEESIMMSSSRYKHHPFRSSPRLPPPTLVPSSTPSAVFTNIQQQRPSIGGAATTGSHHSLPVQSTFLPTNDLR